MKDSYNHLAPVQAVVPVLVKDGAVPAAAEIDLADFNSALIVISCGAKVAGDTGTIDVFLTHGNTSGDLSAVVLADVLGPTTVTNGIIKNLATAAVVAGIYKVGYVGGKRYIGITVTESGTNSKGTMMSIEVIKGHGLDVPAI